MRFPSNAETILSFKMPLMSRIPYFALLVHYPVPSDIICHYVSYKGSHLLKQKLLRFLRKLITSLKAEILTEILDVILYIMFCQYLPSLSQLDSKQR